MEAPSNLEVERTNLPAELTSFVGRRAELAQARRLLGSGRLVTLTGTGGVGKTRLAGRVAAGPLPGADQVWWVELAEHRDDGAVADAVAEVLGVRAVPGCAPADALAGHLAARRVLLVLDNCEHLVRACGRLVHRLLRRCPELRVLATSREPLGVPGEFVLPVPPLAAPDGGAPDTRPAVDSVELFVQRATAGCPDFRLTEHNAAQVARICRELDGVPLALELAAVAVRSLPLEAITLRRTDPDRPNPSSGPTSEKTCHGPPPHSRVVSWGDPGGAAGLRRTLRASVAWSHGLCSADERAVWARLSVFAGGFDLDAATAVCSGPDLSAGHTVDAVAGLVDKSILLREERGGPVRYRMLGILLEFGRERLAADETARLTRRHRDWFRALAEDAAARWAGPEQPALVARLRADHRNLRAAFTAALVEAPVDALRLAAALEHYWLIRGRLTEGRGWLDRALVADAASAHQADAGDRGQPTDAGRKLPSDTEVRALPADTEVRALPADTEVRAPRLPADAAVRARALRVDAYLTVLQRRDDAEELLARVRALLAGGPGPVESAWVDLVDGLVALCASDLERAATLMERAHREFAGRGEPLGAAYAAVMLTTRAAAGGDLAGARYWHERAEAVPAGERQLRGFARWGLGVATLRAGEPEPARALLRDGLRLQAELGDHLGGALSIEVLSWVEVALGRPERAAVLLGATEGLWSPMRMTVASIGAFGRFGQEYEQRLADELGPRRRQAGLRRGGAMNHRQALAFALDDPAPAAPGPLTARELEVAAEVALGHTNRRISVQLNLSQRTVEGHLERIMTKLGVRNRAQVAAWTTENGFAGR